MAPMSCGIYGWMGGRAFALHSGETALICLEAGPFYTGEVAVQRRWQSNALVLPG